MTKPFRMPLFHELTARDLDRVAGALCAESDRPDMWWPDGSNAYRTADAREAIATCNRCPVRTACLDQALRFDEREGIWGALTPDQRKALKEGNADVA